MSGIFTGGSGSRYDLNYSYQNNIGNQNLTGSPDYGARILLTGDLGSGCSSNQFKQFNTGAVAGPTYNSVGLESGRNYLVGCPDHTTDLAIARNIRLGGGRQVQLRLDAFNAFNTAIVTGRVGSGNTNVSYNSPADQTVRNAQYLADGSLDPNRVQPRNAGFGAANAWSTNSINNNYTRCIQFTVRVQF